MKVCLMAKNKYENCSKKECLRYSPLSEIFYLEMAEEYDDGDDDFSCQIPGIALTFYRSFGIFVNIILALLVLSRGTCCHCFNQYKGSYHCHCFERPAYCKHHHQRLCG